MGVDDPRDLTNAGGEALYRAVVGTAVDAIIAIDRRGRMLSVNRAAEGLFGYTASELLGCNVSILMPEPYSSEHDGYLANYLATGKKKIIGIGREVVGRRKDGTLFAMDLAVGEARVDGNPIFVGIIRDITTRKAAESARRSSELRLRSILETVPDAIIVIDKRGIVRSFSPAAERLFGYPRREVEGQNVSMLMPSPYRDDHDSYLARYLKTGERRIIGIGRLVVGRRKDGETFPLELSVGEFMLENEQFFTGFVRDVTERQQAEKRVQDLQSELLHVSRLSAMGQMASTLAHELNQPLTAVTNYLQAARRLITSGAGEAGRVDEIMEKAVTQAARAGQVIRRLRDFVAKGETERRVEALDKAVEEAVALALVGAKQLGIRVTMDLGRESVPVIIDRIQVQQVVLNLVRNAVEAMERAERRELSVFARPASTAGNIEIVVADTGAGIAPDVAARLFQPFVTTKENGMGLGLSICREIVEAHGGRLVATANVPTGAVFSFSLPIATADDLGPELERPEGSSNGR